MMRTPAKIQTDDKLQPPANGRFSLLRVPAYAQVAQAIKTRIATGEYPPGSRIPAETLIGQNFGVALMTVRQAIRVLVEQGLLRRIHGIGTFVCGPDWTRASFGMEGLIEILGDRPNLDIRILSAGITEASPAAAEALSLPVGEMVVVLRRLVSHRGRPFLLNRAYLAFDPNTPIVESEMEASSLYGLFTGEGNNFIKKAALTLEPTVLGRKGAGFLELGVGTPAFRILYTFFGYDDRPVGSGWFMIPPSILAFSTRIGVWDDDES
jgi:GntR family transcriptional regulator